jgi:biotin carboxyl carrier protein
MTETTERIMSVVDFSDPATIAFLAAALQAAGIDGIEINQPGRKLRIVAGRDAPGAAPLVQIVQTTSRAAQSDKVTAPMAGVFGSHHPASSAPPSEPPLEVAAGDTLGFIRIGSILLPVKAVKPGVLTRRVAEDGSVVGYGDPLFEFEPRP